MTSQYETVEGTPSAAHVEHEPRIVKRVIVPDGTYDTDHDLMMMTEIGDGVFVQWSSCRTCSKRVFECKCKGGPTDAPFMKRWRDERFKHDLNTRPDPAFPLLDSVIEWVRERGYTVTKNEPAEVEASDDENARQHSEKIREEFPGESNDQDVEFQEDPDNLTGMDLGEGTDPIVKAADTGLDAALDKVRLAREDANEEGAAREVYSDDIPDDF